MPKRAYVPKEFTAAHVAVIKAANAIIAEYAGQGFSLTLRQLYYQFVSRDLIANNMKEYKRLGSIINDARLAGLIDWDAIEDRNRSLRRLAHWTSPRDIVESCANQFRVDLWEGQTSRVEVWIEKDALVGVIEGVCTRNDVPFFSCRGYTSQSEMWSASQRIVEVMEAGKGIEQFVILHLGDHDPSGIDMSRDIEDRLTLFCQADGVPAPEFKRIALNRPQIAKYRPPPNPAKITDSRADKYIKTHGKESWELDALSPKVLAALIEGELKKLRDPEPWAEREALIEKGRAQIAKVAKTLA